MPLDGQRRRLERAWQDVHRRLFGRAGRRFRRPPIPRIKDPADLAGVPVSVGYQSGSHYSTVQALEQYLKPEQINLVYSDGMLFARMEKLFEGKAPAVHLFGGPYYFAEQLGFRKVIDCTFMIGTMIHGDPDPEDLRKFFRALRKAQRDIDLRPELYTHYYKNEFPDRFHDKMDTRRWGPGERLVFEPYTKEVYEELFEWIASHGIFPEGKMGKRPIRARDFVAGLIASVCTLIVRLPTNGAANPGSRRFSLPGRSGILAVTIRSSG